MDRTGSTSTLAPKTPYRQFFLWAVKWFYGNVTEDTSTKPDIPSIICLLQSVGFKLREFEKSDQLIPATDPVKHKNVRITMECGSSKMVAVLEADEISCECPDNNSDAGADGSFWSISGTGPVSSSLNNVSKIEETGSNLLPEMSKETSAVVRDVAHRLFKLINNKADINQNTDSNMNIPDVCAANSPNVSRKGSEFKEGLIRSYTDYYDKNFKPQTSSKIASNLTHAKFGSSRNELQIKGTAAAALKRPTLNRQGTYELKKDDDSIDEPRSSPPKHSNSPVLQQICTSLGQISMQSDDEPVGLADYVVKAHQILEKAVGLLLNKIPLSNASDNSIIDDKEFTKPAPPPLMSSSFCVGSPRSNRSNSCLSNRSISSGSSSRPGSACSVPRKMNQSMSRPATQKPLTRRSVAGTTNAMATNNLPPMRDRASSLNAAAMQRPSILLPSPSKAAGNLSGPGRKRCATTGASGIAQRPTLTRQLPASKLAVTKGASANSSSTLGSKIQINATTTPTPRGNLSFIRTPSTTSRLNSGSTPNANASSISKFGYSGAKK